MKHLKLKIVLAVLCVVLVGGVYFISKWLSTTQVRGNNLSDYRGCVVLSPYVVDREEDILETLGVNIQSSDLAIYVSDIGVDRDTDTEGCNVTLYDGADFVMEFYPITVGEKLQGYKVVYDEDFSIDTQQ